jgi:hypothetical protein
MFDQDLRMFAFDHKNPLINIVYQVLNVDMNIEHLFVRPISIVHFLVYDSDDLYKLEQLLINKIPIDQHHVDSLHVHELLKKKILEKNSSRGLFHLL